MDNVIIDKAKNKRIIRNIFSLSLAQCISLLGSNIYNFAISLFVLAQTGSGLNYAFTLVMGIVPGIVLGPVSGVLADRFSKKKIIVYTDFISAIVAAIIFLLYWKLGFQIILIYISNMVLAICNTIANGSVQSSFPFIVDEKRLTKVNSIFQTIESIAAIVGPAVGGFLYMIFSIKIFLLFNCISFLIATLLDCLLDMNLFNDKKADDISEKNEESKSLFKDLKESVSYIKMQKWLVILSGFAVFLNMFSTISLSIAIPVVALKYFEMSSSKVGGLQSIFTVGSIIGSLLLYNLPEKEKIYKRIRLSTIGASLSIFAIGVISFGYGSINSSVAFYLLGAVLIIFSIFATFYNIPFFVALQKKVPSSYLGRVRGVILTVVNFFTPIGALIGGFLVDIVNPCIILVVSGVIMTILSLILALQKPIKEV